ncbi:MAG TPA: MFS transporter [Usitatibacter sp.]|nr:MFS transporter [Usitatibacter sp.]
MARSFHFFLWTRFLGTAANQMLLVALGWQMYDLTGSALDLGFVGLLQFVPTLLFTIPAGQLADRVDRRIVLGASLATQGLTAAVLTWASFTGIVGPAIIFGMSIALGISRALQAPALQSIVPSLVPKEELTQAMALSTSAMKIAVIGGPALGGFLYAAGASVVYGVCFALNLVSLVTVSSIPRVLHKSKEPVSWNSVFAGFAFLWNHRVALGAISLDLFAVLLGSVTALLPIFAKDILHVGPWGLGLLRAAPAVGALAMGIYLARNPIERHVGRKLLVAIGIYGVTVLGFGLSTEFWISLVMLAIGGSADMVSIVVRQTLVQLETPDDMRGRVSAVNSTFISASNQLGEFRAGATAALIGSVPSVVVGGAGTVIVVALWTRLFGQLARRDRMTA